MEEDSTSNAVEDLDLPLVEVSTSAESPAQREASTSSEGVPISSTTINNDESGVGLDSADDCNKNVTAESLVEHEPCEPNDDARLLGDLDSLPAGDDLVLGASGSDSGVEGCGGGSRSCASSVVSCGSGCGSESSSVAGAPPRLRRRVNVTVTKPKRSSPFGSSTPRPVTAPRGPNLATRKRARSREKPTSPEKPRPLTPKPRIRPTGELPNLVRESPALRAKPTKTSTARCRTPNSPSEEKRWPSNGPRLTTVTDPSATRVAADKYGTLPRRRRENGEPDGSPKHDITPPTSRRPTITRSVSTRTATKGRVRIYAENNSQTVLIGADVESALAGVVPNIEFSREITRSLVRRCHRGVQASARDTETTRLAAAAAAAEAAAAEERERRQHAEAQLAAERAARLAAIAELDRNSQRLLKLAGPGAGAGAEGCLRTLEEQLRSAGELAARQRGDIDALREHCDRLHHEACSARESGRVLQARLAEAECEMAEMQDFLAAETGALGDSLREVEAEVAMVKKDRKRRRAECRQLVRMCEQRRQEALGAAARARSGGGAAHALDALGRRLARLTDAVPRHALEPQVYHNDAFRDKIDVSEKNVTDVVVKKLAELDASKNMMDQYRQSVEALKKQLAQAGEDDDLNFIEEEQPAPSVLSRCAGAGHLPAPAPRRVARLQAAADDSMSDRRSLLSIASGIYEEIPDLPEQLYTKMSRHDAPDGPTCGNETKSDKCKTEVERVIRLEKPTYASVEECVYATMRRTGKRCPPPPLPPRLPFGTMKLGESWNSRMNTDAVTRHSSLGYSVSSTSSDCKTKILPKYRQAFSVFRKCLKSDSRIMSPKSETAKENKDVETKKKKFDFTPTRDIFKNFKVSRKMKNLKIAPGSLSKAGETKSCEVLDETDHVTTARCSKSIECLENYEFDDFDADLSLEFNDDFVTSLALPQEIVDLILRREQMNMIRLKSEMSESDYLPMSPICPPTPVEYHYVVMSPSTNLA